MSIKQIFYFLSMGMVSCTYLSKARDYQPCHFNKENLSVIGSDIDFKDSICFKQPFQPTIVRMLDDNSITYYSSFSKIKSESPMIFDIKICHCKDTLWAKNQIISEIQRLYPFSLVDTVQLHRLYNISLIDPSKLVKSKLINSWPILESDSIYFHNKGVSYSFVSNEVGFLIFLAKENKSYRCKLEEITSHYGDYNQMYDLSIRNEFLESYRSSDTPPYKRPQKTIKEVQTYVLDSLGFKIDLVDEFTIPIKLVKFL